MSSSVFPSKVTGRALVALIGVFAISWQSNSKAQALPFRRPAPAQLKAKEIAPTIHDKWAVLVGLSHFQDPGITAQPFSERAVMVLRSALYDPEVGKFERDHVVSLIQEQATKQAIVEALADSFLMKKALPNDLIFIYLCSKALPNKNGTALTVCAYDTTLASADRTGIDLQDVLTQLRHRTQCKNIICCLDLSPLSDDSSPPTAQLFSLPANFVLADKTSKPTPLERLALMSNVSLFSASALLDPSYQSESRKNSYFGYYLADSFRQPGPLQPLHEVSQFVSDNVRNDVNHELHKEQNVELRLAADNAGLGAVALGVVGGKPQATAPMRIGHQYDRLALDRPDLMLGATHNSTLAAKTEDGAAADDDDDDEPSQEVDMGPYLKHMKSVIQAKWQTPKGLEQKKVVVVFTILKDGTIADPEITEASGAPEVDQSALQALKVASPLPPLPMGAPKSIRVKYKFEWKVARQP